jgi:GNAT superfamily N-acetyltransferase
MVYNSADDSDVISHHKYHFKQRKLSPKASNALLEDWTSYSGKKHCIFRVTVESSVQDKEFALRALEASYEELPGLILGDAELFSYTYDQTSNSKVPRYNIYFQTIDGKFVGIVLAEAIRRGGELYRGPVKFDMQGKYHSDVPTTEMQEWISFDHSFETPVCIDRVWVHHAHQRQGIATKLIDVVCQTFADRPLAKRQVAISLPTEIGAKFATNYFREAAWIVSDEKGYKYRLPFIVNVRDAKFLIVHGRLEENKGIWRPLKHQILKS